MLHEIAGALGVICAMLFLTVFLPGLALTGSVRKSVAGTLEWVAIMAIILVPAGLFGVLLAYIEML